jgi:hypothetical protein
MPPTVIGVLKTTPSYIVTLLAVSMTTTAALDDVVVKFGALFEIYVCGVMLVNDPFVMTDSVSTAPTARCWTADRSSHACIAVTVELIGDG